MLIYLIIYFSASNVTKQRITQITHYFRSPYLSQINLIPLFFFKIFITTLGTKTEKKNRKNTTCHVNKYINNIKYYMTENK